MAEGCSQLQAGSSHGAPSPRCGHPWGTGGALKEPGPGELSLGSTEIGAGGSCLGWLTNY